MDQEATQQLNQLTNSVTTLNTRVDGFSERMKDLNARLDSLIERMDKESTETNERFKQIDEHFAEIYERFATQEDFNTKLFNLAYKTQQDLEDFKEQAATKDDINRILNDILNKQSTDELERAAANHQLNRHEETNAEFEGRLINLETMAKQHGWAV